MRQIVRVNSFLTVKPSNTTSPTLNDQQTHWLFIQIITFIQFNSIFSKQCCVSKQEEKHTNTVHGITAVSETRLIIKTQLRNLLSYERATTEQSHSLGDFNMHFTQTKRWSIWFIRYHHCMHFHFKNIMVQKRTHHFFNKTCKHIHYAHWFNNLKWIFSMLSTAGIRSVE